MRLTFYKNGTKKPSIKIQPVAGTIVAYGGSSAPNGWLVCNGSVVSQSAYPSLYDVIKTYFNTGSEGAGNFRLPNFIGRIPVGAGTGAGNNSSGQGLVTGTSLTARTVGQTFGASSVTLTAAESGFPAHSHPITESNHGSSAVSPQSSASHPITSDGNHRHQYGFTGTDPYQPGGSWVNYYPFDGSPSYPYNSAGPSGLTFTIGSSTSAIHDGNNNSNVVGFKSENAASSHTNIQPSLVVNYIIKT